MRILKLIQLLCLCLFISASVAIANANSTLETTLVSFGYKITHKATNEPTDWEKSEFNLQSKQHYAIKSLKPVRGERGLYYRFAVSIETYKDEADAQKRMERIKATPPGVDSKMEPEYTLREGFRRGNLVYVISTDVYKFVLDGDLSKLREKLEKKITE